LQGKRVYSSIQVEGKKSLQQDTGCRKKVFFSSTQVERKGRVGSRIVHVVGQ
jgi:hypothetical protein